MQRLLPGVVSSLCVCALMVLLLSASAQALEVHRFEKAFSGTGSAAGELEQPEGVAVNDATESLTEPAGGDVYVVDKGNNRVERFSATGEYLGQFDGSGVYEVREGGAAKVEHGTAAPSGALLEPTLVAVDDSGLDASTGDVYVIDRGHGVVDKFSPVGAYLGQLKGTPVVKNANGEPTGGLFEVGEVLRHSIAGIAIDSAGKVWVSLFDASIYGFDDGIESGLSSEVLAGTIFGTFSGDLGVDAGGDFYARIGAGEYVKLSSAGEILANPFAEDTEAGPVAVDPIGGEVYLDNRDAIEAFNLSGEPIESDQPGASFPAFGVGELVDDGGFGSEGVAVNSSDGTVYATDRTSDTVSVFDAIVLPGVSVTAVSGQQPRSVTLNGTVNPEGKSVSSCVFEYAGAEEYAASKAYAHSVPCEPGAGALGAGTGPVSVSAKIKGLAPQSTYDYRLVAENAGGKSPSVNRSFVAGPILGVEFVTDVTASGATLRAPLDPNGADTHYYFEYGASEAYGSYAPVSPPGVDIGSGLSQQTVEVRLQGLAVSTAYHYRFVAVQDGEVFAEPDRMLTTQGVGVSGALADGRQWELVSPPDSNGALIELFQSGGQVQAAADGSGIAYPAEGPSLGKGPRGNIQQTMVLSRRGAGGWGTVNLTLPDSLPENGESAAVTYGVQPEYHLFSPDLSGAVVEPQEAGTPPLAPAVTTERTLYLRNDLDGSFTPLVSPADVPPGTQIEEQNFNAVKGDAFPWEMHFLAATPDLSHVVFKTPKKLTENAIDEESAQDKSVGGQKSGEHSPVQWNLYEWGAGQLGLVNILPDEEVAHGRAPKYPPVRLAGMEDGGGNPYGGVQREMSDSGQRIAWTWGLGLFVRDMVEGRTVKIGGEYPIYQTMNSEGSRIFYLENGDLHVYDWETETSTNLTAHQGVGKASDGVQELVSDVSEDGTYVYFVATGVLAPGGASGADNLYLLHYTSEGWATSYIATLSHEDLPSWHAEDYQGVPFLSRVSSRVSPDGRYLAFMSNRSLTGYDNTDAVSGQPDEEVFLYDAGSGSHPPRLMCASCDPTGARPIGADDHAGSELLVDRIEAWTSKESSPGDERTDHYLAGSVPGWDGLGGRPSTYQPRYLSNNGRLFFDSPVGLVPQDTNGLEDVYEYEPAGIGNCTETVATGGDLFVPGDGGCVGLISSGTSSTESAFYDASENGNDVFFTTTARLSPLDYDKGYDVYDAHVCTSEVPCTPAPVSVPPCNEGESCKAAPTPQPEIFGAPPSATFNGAGNITPTPAAPAVRKTTKKTVVKCKRSFVRKHGKCLKPGKSKKTKARKADNHRRAAR